MYSATVNLIPGGKKEWTEEIDGSIPSLTDNTWFCLKGAGLAHSSPLCLKCVERLCWGGEAFLHSMQIQGHIQRRSQDDWANVAPSAPHHTIRASTTPGKNSHRHGGHLFSTGASCIPYLHTHAHTFSKYESRDTCLKIYTHRHINTHTGVNDILSIHLI